MRCKSWLTSGLLLSLSAAAIASPPRPAMAPGRAASQSAGPRLAADATRIYPWRDGAQYRLTGAPEQISDIVLQPGESLTSVAAGDTVRWIIGDTSSGAGAGRRTHVLVKPSAVGLRTNLIIATDRRTYHLQLDSVTAGAMPAIAWAYPEDALMMIRRAADAAPVAADVQVEALNFNYAIDGDRPAWRPLRAFDDGRQLFLEFPETLGSGEAPPLFAVGPGGAIELVNYRLRGRYYVVDRLVERAQLRLGGRRQQIVTITRLGGATRRSGR